MKSTKVVEDGCGETMQEKKKEYIESKAFKIA